MSNKQCAICEQISDQMLMLSCMHDPCLNCAAIQFQANHKKNYICSICRQVTVLDNDSISQLRRIYFEIKQQKKYLNQNQKKQNLKYSLPQKTNKIIEKQQNAEIKTLKQNQTKYIKQIQQLKKLVQQLTQQNENLKDKSLNKINEMQEQIKRLKIQVQKNNKDQAQNIGKCKVCLDKLATYVNIPCMHVNLCNYCSMNPAYNKACITCRNVGQYKKIFLSSIKQ